MEKEKNEEPRIKIQKRNDVEEKERQTEKNINMYKEEREEKKKRAKRRKRVCKGRQGERE